MRSAIRYRVVPAALAVAVLTAWAQLVVPGTAPAASAEEAGADGKAIFLAQKCNTCHSIEVEGIEAKTKSEKLRGPDLSGIAADLDDEWLAAFLHKEEEKDGERHKSDFKGTDEELATLIDWLQQLPAAGS